MPRQQKRGAYVWSAALIGVAGLAGASPSFGQSGAGHQTGPDVVVQRCASTPVPTPPSDARRREAHEIAVRAREAAIMADDAVARELYRRSAELDPTDASTAYALGRAYEAARDARAADEYCRFLALAPTAGEAAEVRQRIASLSLAFPARGPAVEATRASVRQRTSPGTALVLGTLFPGLGQYYTGQFGLGLFVTAAVAGALWYAQQVRTVEATTTKTATDPFGNVYTYQARTSRTARPNAGSGIAAAAGISLAAALQAFVHARSSR